MDVDDVRGDKQGPSPDASTAGGALAGRRLSATSLQVEKCVSLPSASFILHVPLQEHSSVLLHNKPKHKQDVRSEVTDMETDEVPLIWAAEKSKSEGSSGPRRSQEGGGAAAQRTSSKMKPKLFEGGGFVLASHTNQRKSP